MENFIQFRLTNVGKAAMLDAGDGSVGFSISLVCYSGNTLDLSNLEQTTALSNILMTQEIAPGSGVKSGHALCIPVKAISGEKLDIKSIGLYTSNGDLVAVTSVESGLIFSLYPALPMLIVFVVVLLDKTVSTYSARMNPNADILKIFLEQHRSANHPHARYLHDPVFQAYKKLVEDAIDEFLHVHCWIGTDNKNFNPADVIYSILGKQTTWVLMPYAPSGLIDTSGEIGVLDDVGGGDSSFLANTTRIWQRVPNSDQ